MNIKEKFLQLTLRTYPQNIFHLEKLAQACLKINWHALPIERSLRN
jgi:hypothetical protein